MNDEFFLGREPILDREEKIYSYTLLSQPAASPLGSGDGDGAFHPADTIIRLLSENGARELLGECKGGINIGFDLLMGDLPPTLPANRIILNLEQNLPLSDVIIRRCHQLKESGFMLALNNHRFSSQFTELYGIVDIIGIDLNRTPADRLKGAVRLFRRHPVRLLAERVDTRDQFTQCRTLGFELFQGFFFATPTVMARKKLNETAATLLRIALLIINEAGVEAIVQTVQESPGLTYKLLLQANSVVVGARREIDSVRHAILLLGRDLIRRWAQVELLAANGSEEQDNPLVEMATMRAGFMEQLSKSHPLLAGSRDAADRAFLTGTLSMLETIYNVSIEDVVQSVELSADVKMALLRREGLFGHMLTLVEALERLDFDGARDILPRITLSPGKILDAQRNSFHRKGGGMSAAVA